MSIIHQVLAALCDLQIGLAANYMRKQTCWLRVAAIFLCFNAAAVRSQHFDLPVGLGSLQVEVGLPVQPNKFTILYLK
jgi:hypothetical protein